MIAPFILLLIAWGAFAFGAVYPWAYQPLFAGCGVIGAAGLVRARAWTPDERALAAALGLVICAMAMQIIPLPVDAIAWLSPSTDAFLRWHRLGYETVVERHPLSIDPQRTQVALGAAIALSCLLLGAIQGLSNRQAVLLVRGICAVGATLAVVGIGQKATWSGQIYGFWTPEIWTPRSGGTPFGPFVNRNHFAGWMLLALPLGLGYLSGRLVKGMRGVKPRWRDRLIWLSSAEASEIVLIALAVFLMAASLVWTASRSGLLGLIAAIAVTGWFVSRHRASPTRLALIFSLLIALPVVAVSWVGSDRITSRFASAAQSVGVDGRVAIWGDTLDVIRAFPLTGTGLNTYGVAMVRYQTTPLGGTHPREAHNDYLQLLAEGGVLVTVPAMLAGLAFVRVVRRRFVEIVPGSTDYWVRAGAVTGAVAMALQETVEFSLQMPGNAAIFTILLGLAARRSEGARRETSPRHHRAGPEVHTT